MFGTIETAQVVGSRLLFVRVETKLEVGFSFNTLHFWKNTQKTVDVCQLFAS